MHREDATLMLLQKEQPMYLIKYANLSHHADALCHGRLINMQARFIMRMYYVMEDFLHDGSCLVQ